MVICFGQFFESLRINAVLDIRTVDAKKEEQTGDKQLPGGELRDLGTDQKLNLEPYPLDFCCPGP